MIGANVRMSSLPVAPARKSRLPGLPPGLTDRGTWLPVAVFLAHESCQLNGEVIISGGGQVQRIAVVETEGITSDALTAEVVAENLDRVMDMSNAQRIDAGVIYG